jgi:hypothetical protein
MLVLISPSQASSHATCQLTYDAFSSARPLTSDASCQPLSHPTSIFPRLLHLLAMAMSTARTCMKATLDNTKGHLHRLPHAFYIICNVTASQTNNHSNGGTARLLACMHVHVYALDPWRK